MACKLNYYQHLMLATDAGLGEIPDARLLAELKEFQHSQSTGTELQSSATELLSLLKEEGVQERPPMLVSVAIGEGLPTLPKKLVERISVEEHVDLAKLPPAKEE